MVNFLPQLLHKRPASSTVPRPVRLPKVAQTKVAQTALVAVLTAIGLVSGSVPQWNQSKWSFSESNSAAHAQSLSKDSIRQFSRALYEIEQLRSQKYAEAKARLGGGTTDCRQNIPTQVQDICQEFNRKSAEIANKYGFDSDEFNNIARRISRGSSLERQIQQEMICIQTPGQCKP